MTAPAPEPSGAGTRDSPDAESERVASLAADVFGSELPVAQRYAELLSVDGVDHGHIGPREIPRLWTRHLLNCAVVSDLLPSGAGVVDVGSGAGLPGLAMAIRRPDLRLTLIEPMERRVEFLRRCVDALGLAGRVEVTRGRADDRAVSSSVSARWVTARAVAPLDRLVGWCLPLLSADGELLAMKGRGAHDEVARHLTVMRRMRAVVREVAELPVGDDVTRVVVIARAGRSAGARVDGRGGR